MRFLSEDSEIPPCRSIMDLPYEKRCEFYKSTSYCPKDYYFLKPFHFMFCAPSEALSSMGIVYVVVMLVFLFIVISVVADAFVCPNVAVIAKSLRLSDNVAGVTIVAFANGIPDSFSALSGAENDHPEILFASLSGSALFTTTLVAGIVICCRPFNLNAWPFFINVLFLLTSYSIIFVGFYKRNYGLYHSIGTLCIYIIYIAVTITENYVSSEHKKFSSLVEKEELEILQIARKNSVYVPVQDKYRMSSALEILKTLERDQIYREMGFQFSVLRYKGEPWTNIQALFTEFKEMIYIQCFEDWKNSSNSVRTLMIIQGSIKICLSFLISVVSPDVRNNGWCKLLIMMNMFFSPFLIVLVAKGMDVDWFGVPVWVFAMLAGIAGAAIIFFTTRTYSPPKGHRIFAFTGFVTAGILINILAHMLILHLEAIGARLYLKNSLLALTVLSFGNSIGDLVVSIGLAKQGLQNIGFSSCFGSPMFNCSFGISLVTVYLTIKEIPIESFYGALSPTATLFLYISLFSTLVTITTLDFKGRYLYGLYLILIYVTFIILIILMETCIHPLSTQIKRNAVLH